MNDIDKKLWMDVYNLADIIYEQAPWDYLWDNNLVSYVKKETGQIYYASILGKSGKYKGLVIVDDMHINDYLKLMEKGFSSIQLLNYQTGIMISYIDSKDIKDDDKIIPRELGISFNDKWITFKKYEKGYLPYNLEASSLELLKELLEAYIMLFSYLEDKKIPLPKDKEMVCRYYLDDNKGYNNVVMPLITPDNDFSTIKIPNENINNVNDLSDEEIEVEFVNYIPIPTGDNYIENKYKLDLYFAVANVKSAKLLDFKLYSDKDYTDISIYYKDRVLDLVDFMINNYKPKTIYVRDELTKALLDDINRVYDIKIELRNSLPIIDGFIEMLIKKK